MIGFLLMLIIFFVYALGSISSAGKASKFKLQPNSILQLDLAASIPDQTLDNPLSGISPLGVSVESATGLFDLIEMIEHAKNDDKIKGIYLKTDLLSDGFPTLNQLRRALEDFKSSGKFIIAYNNISTQKAYLVTSVADEICLNPMGIFEFDGLAIDTRYYKNLLDKLEIKPIPLYAGKFKSASEPYRVDKMSDKNREQLAAILEDLYDNYLNTISEARDISPNELRQLADNLEVTEAKQALEKGFVDRLTYEDEVLATFREKLGYEDDKDLDFVTIDDYKTTFKSDKNNSKNKVAVIYAEGSIVFGKGDAGQIGMDYVKMIRKIRKDDNVKAVVLRVNSGGGSAFTSEQIWRELVLLKEEKPLVVSMGNYAASGGYYIAAMADKIYAEKNTITGSIGVVGILLNMKDFFNNKLGVTFDSEMTGKYSDFGNMTKDWSPREVEVAQNQVKTIYKDFKKRVSEGRDMSMEAVEEIAQGRVWTGQDAIEIGLVDEIGSLQSAIEEAKTLAEIEDYKISTYPEQKDFYEQIKEMISVKTDQKIKEELGVLYDEYQTIKDIQQWEGVQARIPFEFSIN